MKAGNVLIVIGFVVFALGTCMLDSEDIAGMIAIGVLLGGLWIMWLGHILTEIRERRKETNRRIEKFRKSA